MTNTLNAQPHLSAASSHEVANPTRRTVAFLVDVFAFSVALGVIEAVLPFSNLGVLPIALFVAAEMAFLVKLGATPGKLLLGLRVSTQLATFEAPTWTEAFKRSFVKHFVPVAVVATLVTEVAAASIGEQAPAGVLLVAMSSIFVSMICSAILLITVIRGHNYQGLHDTWAKTYVLYK